MAIGPERAIGTGPIGEGPIGPQPDAGGDVTLGWHQPFGRATRRIIVRGVIAAGLVWVPFIPPVTTTGWMQPFSTAAARPRPQTRLYSPFVPKEATVENTVTPDKWLQRWQDTVPVLPVWHTQPIYAAVAPTVENTITIDKWQQPLGMRAVPVPRAAPLGGAPFVPAEATVDNTTVRVWPLTQGEKARPIPRVAPQGFYAFGYPYEGEDNTRNEFDWYIPWPDRFPQVWWKGRPYQPFVPDAVTVYNTTNTVWPLTQGERARPIVRAPLGTTPFVPRAAVLENTVEPDKWMLRWQGPPKYVPNRGPFAPFVPAEATRQNTTNTVWPLTQGEKARPLGRVAPQGAWVFGYEYEAEDNTRTQWDWSIQWPAATKLGWPRRNYLRGGQPFVPKAAVLENTVTPDKWMERWYGPPRYRPRHTQPLYAPQFIFQLGVQHQQEITATLTLTVDIHICGWGTETQASDAAAVESEQADAWAVEPEVEVTFADETQEADAWSEQTQSDDEYDEKDECGRG